MPAMLVSVAWPLGAGRGLKLRAEPDEWTQAQVAWPLGAGRGLKLRAEPDEWTQAQVAWPLGAGRGLKPGIWRCSAKPSVSPGPSGPGVD